MVEEEIVAEADGCEMLFEDPLDACDEGDEASADLLAEEYEALCVTE